ncbi:leucine-rich repeat domain-containing protein [Flammeovirga aprica]|uniref:R13L1/DRL21-like LRR repeat region domain-containing protein n=1 Tax=Flammeovirga aprica JL-4 TaxID=694437 RepID=A0A7X9RQR7_9BACT|nr:leucine-rich repeat domain-containing protein [Flammeovirga aprica]NME67038.1 hypothetical protein [Flammeovirga aprica JL-4]
MNISFRTLGKKILEIITTKFLIFGILLGPIALYNSCEKDKEFENEFELSILHELDDQFGYSFRYSFDEEKENVVSIVLVGDSTLTEIPEQIFNFHKLEKLYISNNAIKNIPYAITNFKNLKVLHIDNNQLKEIPDYLALCDKIESLYVNDNPIDKLPQELKTLPLKKICLENTNIAEYPTVLNYFNSLQLLSLNYQGQKDISDFSELQQLHLYNYQGKILPDNIFKLKKLKVLSIDNCPHLETLPNTVGELASLEQLLITKCTNLKSLPERTAKLKLGLLKLDQCHRLSNIPDNMKVGKIEANHVNWTSIPAGIFNSNVINLKITHHQIRDISGIEAMYTLKYLTLSNGLIESIPDEIGQLKDLEYVNFDHNQIIIKNIALYNCLKLEDESIHLEGNPYEDYPKTYLTLGDDIEFYNERKAIENLYIKYGPKTQIAIDFENHHVYGVTFHSDTISKVPEELKAFKNMKDLAFMEGNIEEIPSFVAGFKELSSMSFYKNPLKRIPDFISGLKKLSDLDLSYTSVRTLPNSMKDLPIKKITLIGSNINHFPKVLYFYKSLEYLSIGYLKKLPADVGSSFRELQWLEAKLGSYENIHKIKSLFDLHLKECTPRTFPDNIKELQKLEELAFISCKRLTELPHSTWKLKNLQNLLLIGCESLKGLPESLVGLKRLQEIRITKGYNFNYFPSRMTLSHLSLEGVRWKRIPESILRSSVSKLEITNHQIESLSGLERMRNLEYCNLSHGKVFNIDEKIKRLKTLKYLDLSHNNLVFLPQELFSLPQLRELDVSYNRIQSEDLRGKMISLNYDDIMNIKYKGGKNFEHIAEY